MPVSSPERPLQTPQRRELYFFALYRVLEVMTGSTVALLQTLVYAWLVRRWRDRASRGS